MYKFSKKQKIIVGIILAILSIALIYYVYSRDTSTLNDSDNQELETYEDEKETKEETDQEKEIVVHIAGAVKTEGVIFLQEGDRINSAIEKAGGTTEEADMSKINLAYELEDGMKIYIPKKGENLEDIGIDEMQEYLTIPNQAEQENTVTNAETSSSKETSSTSTGTKSKSSKININKATQTELETLPGIGASTASKIIAYREENKKFNSIEDIKKVSRNRRC